MVIATNGFLRNPEADEQAIAQIIERETGDELRRLKAILADPNQVRLNLLRGTIAWTPETLGSVLGIVCESPKEPG